MSPAFNDEFVALDHFNRSVHFWWVIFMTAILGAVIGFFVHRAMPPVFEAQAVFTANLDFNKVDFMHPPTPTPPPYELTQYDEDMSLAVVQASLIAVIPQVETFAQQNGFSLSSLQLQDQVTIERNNALWYIRFRSGNPLTAQKIVNFWAQQGYQDLLARQQAGQLPPYIFFDLIHLADLPTSPTYYQTNVFVLAGCLIGIVLGIFLVNLPLKRFQG